MVDSGYTSDLVRLASLSLSRVELVGWNAGEELKKCGDWRDGIDSRRTFAEYSRIVIL